MEGDVEKSKVKDEISQPATSSAEPASEISQNQDKFSSTSLQNEKKAGRRRHTLFEFLTSPRRKSGESNIRRGRLSADARITSSVEQEVVEQKVENPIIRKMSFVDEPENLPVTFTDISKAMYKNRGGIEETECKRVKEIKELSEWEVYFKMETAQPSGSYKDRGVRFALQMLPEDQKKRGVIAASSGNLALSLARQGMDLGIPVTVVMAQNSPLTKALRCKDNKATIRIHGQNQHEAEAFARQMEHEKGLYYIDESDNVDVICGYGTLGLEIVNQVPHVDAIIIPVAQGALLAGVCVAVKTMFPAVQIVAVESKACTKFTTALEKEMPTLIDTKETFSLADELCHEKVGEIPLEIASRYVDTVVTVSEDDIALGMVRAIQSERTVVEGSGVVGLGALLGGYLPDLKDKCVVLPLTSGNLDLCVLERVIQRGLTVAGILVQFIVTLSDRRGSIARLSKIIASTGACVRDIKFERNWFHCSIFTLQAMVVVEVLSSHHARELRTLLEKHYRIMWNTDLPPNEYQRYGTKKEQEPSTIKELK